MNQTVAKGWVEALRSGNFRQGRTYLHVENNPESGTETYCCLGVLCELAVNEGVIDPPVQVAKNFGEYTYDGAKTALPIKVREWAGVTGTQESILMTFNDSDGLPFDKIADWIEENHDQHS